MQTDCGAPAVAGFGVQVSVVKLIVGGLATVRVTVKVAVSGPFVPFTVTTPVIGPAVAGIAVETTLIVIGVLALLVEAWLGTNHGTLEVMFNVSGVLPSRVMVIG